MDFEIKDSGLREEFESGMVRDVQDDKTLYSLIFSGPMLERWAEHLTKGAKKYGANNWLLASGEAELERFRESAVRHFIQWLRGDRDEDHAAAVFFNINGAEYVQAQLDAEDDNEDFEAYGYRLLGAAVPPQDDLVERNANLEGIMDAALDRLLGPSDGDVDAALTSLIDDGTILQTGVNELGEPVYALASLVNDMKCECSPAIYKLIVKNTDSPLDGRMVYGAYSDCHSEWYAFPPGTDPRQGGITYDLKNDQVETVEKVADSIEALLDTP